MNPFQPEPLDANLCGAAAAPDWLWHGYLAGGQITLLTSQWKCGKTTLLSVLLARLAAGGALAGLVVRPGRAVVVSEEGREMWAERGRRLGPMPHVRLLCRPFRGRPGRDEWQALIDQLARLRAAGTLDLVVIDPLASFLPTRGENDAAGVLDALLPLQQLTSAGAAVLILHHPCKGEPPPGQAARGSGAMSACADVLLELGWYGRPGDGNRRRRLQAFSRHPATVARLVLELSADGTDYVAHGDFGEDDFGLGWPVLRDLLEDAERKLTRREILDHWPQDHPKPSDMSLWRWLDRAVGDGRVQRAGRGRCGDPFRYWLTGQEERWAADPYRLPDLPPLPPLREVLDAALARRRRGEDELDVIAAAEAEYVLMKEARRK